MFNTVVVGADDSSTARQAVVVAADIAKLTGGTLHIVTAYQRKTVRVTDLPEEFRYSATLNPADALLHELSLIAKDRGLQSVIHPAVGQAGGGGYPSGRTGAGRSHRGGQQGNGRGRAGYWGASPTRSRTAPPVLCSWWTPTRQAEPTRAVRINLGRTARTQVPGASVWVTRVRSLIGAPISKNRGCRRRPSSMRELRTSCGPVGRRPPLVELGGVARWCHDRLGDTACVGGIALRIGRLGDRLHARGHDGVPALRQEPGGHVRCCRSSP